MFLAARLTLIIQNIAVVACAMVVLIMFKQSISSPIFLVLAVILVLLAIVARLSSLGTTIAIERDWVVIIAKEDEFLLAGTCIYAGGRMVLKGEIRNRIGRPLYYFTSHGRNFFSHASY